MIIKGGDKKLFEYAKQYEDFEKDEDDFFIHCLESNGFSDKDNAQFMGLSAQGYSARKSRVIHENSPRFSLTHHHLYILRTGDPRPAAYSDWLTKKAKEPDRDKLLVDFHNFQKHLPEIKRLIAIMEAKE